MYYRKFSRLKIETGLFLKHIKIFILCLLIQYLHSISTKIAYYRHIPDNTLKDMGFDLIPPLSNNKRYLSEVMTFSIVFFSFLPLIFGPSLKNTYIYFVTVLLRLWIVMAIFAIFRSISFLSTSLPGPSEHCHMGSSEYNPPSKTFDFFKVEFFKGCGDLIFSSHTSVCLVLIITCYIYMPYYYSRQICKIYFYCILSPMFILLSLLIISARKHYTVDVIIAIYVVPMFYYVSYYFYKDQNQIPEYNEVNTDEEITIKIENE